MGPLKVSPFCFLKGPTSPVCLGGCECGATSRHCQTTRRPSSSRRRTWVGRLFRETPAPLRPRTVTRAQVSIFFSVSKLADQGKILLKMLLAVKKRQIKTNKLIFEESVVCCDKSSLVNMFCYLYLFDILVSVWTTVGFRITKAAFTPNPVLQQMQVRLCGGCAALHSKQDPLCVSGCKETWLAAAAQLHCSYRKVEPGSDKSADLIAC